jgi:hypothetical protein
MLLIFTTMVGISFGFPAKARFMPLVVGLPGIVLCLIQLAVDLYRGQGAPEHKHVVHVTLPSGVSPEAAGQGETELPEFGPHTARTEIVTWIYFVCFIAAILAFGFYVSVPIMLVTFLRTQAKASWIFSVALAAAATLVLYLMFGALLGVQLHAGFITPWALRSLGIQAI